MLIVTSTPALGGGMGIMVADTDDLRYTDQSQCAWLGHTQVKQLRDWLDKAITAFESTQQ